MANFDPFEKDIRQRAGELRRDPSAQAWTRIERRLGQQGRRGGLRLFGIRPWMIAALVLIMAGAIALGSLVTPADSPLAQRSQTVEDLQDAFAPADNFDAEAYRTQLRSSDTGRTTDARPPSDFRDLTVAEKYRS